MSRGLFVRLVQLTFATVLVLVAVPAVLVPLGFRTMVVTGGSMEPEVAPGDALVLRRVTVGLVDVGDLVTFRPMRSPTLVTHRVVARIEVEGEPHLQTKGGANDAIDPNLVPVGNVVGTVHARIPFVGYLLALLTSPGARIALVLVPAGIAILLAAQVLWGGRATATVVAASMFVASMLVAGPVFAIFSDVQSVGGNTMQTSSADPPTLTSATSDPLLCTITLLWTAPLSGLTPDGYDVYRATTSGGPYGFVTHVPLVTTTSDTGLAQSSTYYYVLRSTIEGWTSADSNEVSATTGGLCL